MTFKMKFASILVVLTSLNVTRGTACPWGNEEAEMDCTCEGLNINEDGVVSEETPAKLPSIQCRLIPDMDKLASVITAYGLDKMRALLIRNCSTPTPQLQSRHLESVIFVEHLQLSGCGIRRVSPDAFSHVRHILRHLSLRSNRLEAVPVRAISILGNLTHLDVSHNGITAVADDSFASLARLSTLTIGENNLTSLGKHALRGLENTLKQLSAKACTLERVPFCLRNLTRLTFLDLSRNRIARLNHMDAKSFERLHSLTSLNMERNLIVSESLTPDCFYPLSLNLTSFSLLNNLLTEFPTTVISVLPQLKVLDVGFNLISELNNDAFTQANNKLALLAIDGNPIESISEESMLPLEGTLKGLSLGGRWLNCDCRLLWLVRWVRMGRVKITSRERNPQYCSTPDHLRHKAFNKIEAEELSCDDIKSTMAAVSTEGHLIMRKNDPMAVEVTPSVGYSKDKLKKSPIVVKSASRRDNSVIIRWDGDGDNNGKGYRVLYRLFAEKHFKRGPPLYATDREFKIKNVPPQECIVVCVVSLDSGDDVEGVLDAVTRDQCQEIRTDDIPGVKRKVHGNATERITIAASAAVCLTIVILIATAATAVILIAAYKRKKMHAMTAQTAAINCCPNSNSSLSASKPALSSFAARKESDQISAYSNQSIINQHSNLYNRAVSETDLAARSTADGQSSNHSVRHFAPSFANFKSELRESRQSLATSDNYFEGNKRGRYQSCARVKSRSEASSVGHEHRHRGVRNGIPSSSGYKF